MFLVLRVIWSILSALAMKLFPPKSKDIRGKVVLITGAARGIGQQLTYKFASLGVKLAIVDLNEKGMMETKDDVERSGATCKTYRCDISKRDHVAKLGALVREDLGNVDILVNNAGVIHVKNCTQILDSEISQIIEVNLLGTMWMVQEFLPDMVDRNDGHIVNFSSLAGIGGFPLAVHYCASKFGIKGFGEALAADLDRLGMTGIHITTIYPGLVDTPMVTTLDSVDVVLGDEKFLKSEFVAEKVVEGVLINKRNIYIPDKIWYFGALTNSLPIETMKMLINSKRFGFYERLN